MDEIRERGVTFFDDVLGTEDGVSLRQELEKKEIGHFGSESARFAADFAFGTIWTRGGLERKQRSLVVMGILIAQRQVEELKIHVRIALSNGLTVREIEEVLYQAIPYAGFPAVNSAKIAMIEALKELGVEKRD